ncbi:MAG: hypothetical protein U0Q16_20855 [Bryobacteraceae bacterium]
MRLFNQAGESFDISAGEWNEVLVAAERYGWHPRGTSRPAVSWDFAERRQWDGDYRNPKGQIVIRQDAAALATAVDSSIHESYPFQWIARARVRQLLEFCETGPFLISAIPGVEDSAFSGQLVALDSVLSSGRATPVEESSPNSAFLTRR